MQTDNLILFALIAGAILCAVKAFQNTVSSSDSQAPEKANLPALFSFFDGGISYCASLCGSLLASLFPSYTRQLKNVLLRSGLKMDAEYIYGAHVFFGCLALILIFFIVISPTPLPSGANLFLGLVILVVAEMYPRMLLDKRAAKREEEIMHHLPFAIDLITSSMNAGLDFGAAVRYFLTTGGDDLLRKEFSVFLQEVELGKNRTEALRDMQQRINITEFSRFVSAIAYGMDSGSSIINVMRIQAEEMRRVRYTRAEQQAAKAPTKMIIPMALFVFPSMFIVIFIPIFLKVKDSGILSMIGK